MEQMGKWSIGLISTSKDLDTNRREITDALEKMGFQVVAFENGNFTVDAEEEKNIACVSAFDNIDIAIILVGNELGYSNDEMISITCKEYEHIVELGKYRFVFVNKTTWDNYQTTEGKKLVQSTPFLDYINNEKKDFINYFYDIAHLKELIREKLKGLSILLLKQIAKSQYTKLMNSITIPSIGNAVRDQLKYYLSPKINPLTDALGETIDSSCLYKRLINPKTVYHILVYGGIGSGKSMLLYKNYYSHFCGFNFKKIVRIPLFLSLRGKTREYSIEDYFRECFKYHLGKSYYPLFAVDSKSFVLYVDGLDEMSDISSEKDISRWLSEKNNIDSMLISCRTDFYNCFVRESGFSFDIRLLIEKWDTEKSTDYIKAFFDGKPFIQDYALEWIEKHLSNWMNTPLLVAIICFYLLDVASYGENIREVLNNIVNEVTLLSTYTKLFIKRELKRIQQDSAESEAFIINELTETAWQFYTQKRGDTLQYSIPKNDTSFQSEITKSFFGIIEINNYYVYSIHEYFIDYLVSLYFLNQLVNGSKSGHFDYMLSAEINKLIFQQVEGLPEEGKQSIITNLNKEYSEALVMNNRNIERRTHIVYFLSRIKSDSNKDFLCNILYNIEKETEIKLSLCFGMIKLGDLEIEKYLYQQVESVAEWDKTNRGYHLMYYRDVEGKKIPYLDENISEWSKTFTALKSHICEEKRYYYLARIDLQIIKRFIISHKKHYFTKETINDFENAVCEIGRKGDDFCMKVIDEWSQVKAVLSKLSPELF